MLKCWVRWPYGGDWECIVCDLETIKDLVLLVCHFNPQRSHHSLTLQRSRLRESATATLTHPRMAQQLSEWSHWHELIHQYGKKLRGLEEER